jgi:hypothetical protein
MLNLVRILAFLILGCSQSFGQVVLDSCSTVTHGAAAASTVAHNSQTVGAALTNGILTVILVVGNNASPAPTAMTAQWDNLGTPQAMTAVAGTPVASGTQKIFAFYLLNPTAGNKQLVASWTNNAEMLVQTCSFQGASGVANFNSSTGGTPQTVAITAGANDMAFAGFSSTSNFISTAPTQINLDNTATMWAVGWARASGSNPTLSGSPGNATSLTAGFSITSSGGGGGPTCSGGMAARGAGVC